ncbi:MAG: isoprenylcysteine carboxylmethyltransferase family protein [Bacteroidota bacterium]
MYYLNVILLLMLAANFASFIWAAYAFFGLSKQQQVAKGTRWLSSLVLLAQGWLLVWVAQAEIRLAWHYVLGVMLVFGSSLLFWRCLQIHGERSLSPAYAEDLPEHLVKKGPYRWIRHPFYTAYLLSYLGGVVAAPGWWILPALLLPYGVYHAASSFEEAKFAKSTLSRAYADYRRQAGRFWPKLGWGWASEQARMKGKQGEA